MHLRLFILQQKLKQMRLEIRETLETASLNQKINGS